MSADTLSLHFAHLKQSTCQSDDLSAYQQLVSRQQTIVMPMRLTQMPPLSHRVPDQSPPNSHHTSRLHRPSLASCHRLILPYSALL